MDSGSEVHILKYDSKSIYGKITNSVSSLLVNKIKWKPFKTNTHTNTDKNPVPVSFPRITGQW